MFINDRCLFVCLFTYFVVCVSHCSSCSISVHPSHTDSVSKMNERRMNVEQVPQCF